MGKPTPGPWLLDDEGTTVYVKRCGWRPAICTTQGENAISALGDLDQRRANARLIAAAPDLLAALQTLERAITNNEPFSRAEHEQARAALAKARG